MTPAASCVRTPLAGVGGSSAGSSAASHPVKTRTCASSASTICPPGGIEIDVGVLFADVRDSTGLGERSTATEFASQLNRFYAVATEVLIRHDALIDKLIGDEVMGLFLAGLAGPDYRNKTALAAIDLAAATTALPVGVAANAGVAFVGNVGSGTVLDFTALGDAVNVGARLQSFASPGEVVLSSNLYDPIAPAHPGRPHRATAGQGSGRPGAGGRTQGDRPTAELDQLPPPWSAGGSPCRARLDRG